jgi:hypothetical protein
MVFKTVIGVFYRWPFLIWQTIGTFVQSVQLVH